MHFMKGFQRDLVAELSKRLREPRRFIQVVQGPRQVGKTTAVEKAREAWDGPSVYAAADLPSPPTAQWIEQQWDKSRAESASARRPALLVLDEIHKIERWSEVVKRCWDEDSRLGRDIRVVLLGSSAMLVGRGLSESLSGRFELQLLGHWQWAEMQAAFGWDLDRFLFFGGYPGAAALARQPERWRTYVKDSLIDTVLSRDVLMLNLIDKPALLRKLFVLACEYGGQALSYTKLMGELSEAGNTTTLASYQSLLERSWLLAGLGKWSGSKVRQRNSSPKWLPLNTALMTSLSGESFEDWRSRPDRWGRLVEVAAGGRLFFETRRLGAELFWWRDGNHEVDYVVKRGRSVLAVEVKSGARPRHLPGLGRFQALWPGTRALCVGEGGEGLAEFLAAPLERYL